MFPWCVIVQFLVAVFMVTRKMYYGMLLLYGTVIA